MKSHESVSFIEHVLMDSFDQCSIQKDSRDLKYIRSRVKDEGVSFVTITLPNFLQDLMKALERGKVVSSDFAGWRKHRGLPSFLKGFTTLIFREDGELKDVSKNQIMAIRAIRQICSLLKKVKLECTIERTSKALSDYCHIDAALESVPAKLTDKQIDEFFQIAGIVTTHAFKDFEKEKLIPKHGPGSTADRVLGNQKWKLSKRVVPAKILETFDLAQNFYPNELYAYEDQNDFNVVPEIKAPARVTTVPKTLKTPRVIALEPTTVQYLQQPIKDYVVNSLERCPLTNGHINFRDQKINKDLALKQSKELRLATVDLSAASDRVHKEFVYWMMSSIPDLRNCIFATRSEYVKVRGELVKLNKFASMGSALCFPMEALYFFILCIQSRLNYGELSVTPQNIRSVVQDIYVYGDDILLPVDEVETMASLFSDFGNKVGLDKSFYKGAFRESCGMDAYGGFDITPIYVRQHLPTWLRDVSSVISSVETANMFADNGYMRVAQYIRKSVESITGMLPCIGPHTEGLGWTFGIAKQQPSYNQKLQVLEVLTLVPSINPGKDRINGVPALLKCLLKLERRPKGSREPSVLDRGLADVLGYDIVKDLTASFEAVDKRHLNYSASLGTLTLKTRWVRL